MKRISAPASALAALVAATLAGPVAAQTTTATTSPAIGTPASRDDNGVNESINEINKSAQVLQQMRSDPALAGQLRRAKAVFVVPEYGRAALGVGARGGSGVLFVQRNGTWTDPAFYNMGGMSIGAQAGGEGGAIAFVLNNQRALNSFMQDNNWSLNANAGLTIVEWSKKGQVSAGRGDVTVWSSTAGLFGGAAISVTDINFDEEQTAAYYGRRVAARDVVSGGLTNPHAASLRQTLAAAGLATSQMGSSGTAGSAASGTTTPTTPATPTTPSSSYRDTTPATATGQSGSSGMSGSTASGTPPAATAAATGTDARQAASVGTGGTTQDSTSSYQDSAGASAAGQSGSSGMAATGSSSGGAATGAPPAVMFLLVPMVAPAQDPMMKNGCWVKLHDNPKFSGDELALSGPINMPNMVGPFGIDWKGKISSIETGPKATLMIYDNENYRDLVSTFKPGQRVADVSKKMGFFDQMASLKISCSGS